jgi:diguanylate cyclase
LVQWRVMPTEVSVEEALNRADASMYAVKRQRRAAGEGGNPPPSSQVSAPR